MRFGQKGTFVIYAKVDVQISLRMRIIWSRHLLYVDRFYELELNKTNNKTSATSEDSGQPVHPRSLIRVFADRMCILRPSGYPKRDKREPSCHTGLMYRLIWVFAGYTDLIVGFPALAPMLSSGRWQLSLSLSNGPKFFPAGTWR